MPTDPPGLDAELPGTRPVRRREVFGYCMFDFANSSYTTLISTVAFSLYFRQAVVGPDHPNADLLWSIAGVSAHLVLILTSPLLGAVADYSGRKKRFLLLTTVQTVTACALLFIVHPGEVLLGIALYIVATVGFEGGYIFYNAFLPEVSTPKTIGRISGWSWGTGFLGGMAALLACSMLLRRELIDPVTRLVDPVAAGNYRLSFVVVAGFFALFAVPTFAFLRETPSDRASGSWMDYARIGVDRVRETVTHLRRYRETGKLVLAYLFYFGGIETVIKFSAIYATVTFGLSGAELFLLFVITNIVAVPGTLAAGYLADRIGGRRAIALTLLLWIGLLLWGALATSKPAFWIMACGIAIGMGSTQAIGRSFMAQITPASRQSEFFGYYVQAGRVGAILALLLFGVISSATGNQRLAVLWLLPLFVAGLLLVWRIDQTAARDAVSEG